MKKIAIPLVALLVFVSIPSKAEAATSYSISPGSKTFQGKMMNFSTYNKNTKHYYLLRSYLERLEKTGGGTLTLKKGTYTITNTLYVPSNVTIVLKNGVVLKKGNYTGNSRIKPAKSMFQLVRPSKANKSGVYGGYNGEKNIKFIGEGSAQINMNFLKDGIAIIAGHNRNITIQNIKFKNMYSGHFIELDASQNVTIKNNQFTDSYASSQKIKEAINLDTPDKLTEGWSQKWSKFDKTANKNVYIKNNRFYNLDVAVGTHNYSQGKLHTNIVMEKNVIDKMRTHGIRVMNWSKPIIQNNTIKNVSGSNNRGILASGAINPTFKNNNFQNVGRAIQFIVWKNNGKAKSYKTIYNTLSNKNIADLESNTLTKGTEGFIRFNTVLNNYTTKTKSFPLKVVSLTTKPKKMFASKSNAKAYKTTSKTGGYYKVFPAGSAMKLYPQGNGWLYGYVTSKGVKVRAYFHDDETQSTKPFLPKRMYVVSSGAKVYQKASSSSTVLTTLKGGRSVNAEDLGNGWSTGYVTYNNVSVKAFFLTKNLQSTPLE